MAEIERVDSGIKAYIQASEQTELGPILTVLENTAAAAYRRYAERTLDDKYIYGYIDDALKFIKELSGDPPTDKDELIKALQEAAKRAMLAQRALYPRGDPRRTLVEPPSVMEALYDDDDAYSFAIFDTLAEEIQALSPALYQLAIEDDWEKDSE